MVRRGLATTRAEAQSAVTAGRVLVSGAPADKPARLVAEDEPVVIVGPGRRFVGRGGEKLDAALGRFAIDVAGRRALDAGASTGGFTDCLLQRGAASVVAVDVGRGQLHERLRRDRRVTVRERLNIRHLDLADVGPDRFGVVTADVSFISLVTVMAPLMGVAGPGADVVLLVKPQFEAGRADATRGRGVIRDPAVWEASLRRVGAATEACGAAIMGWMVSPLLGADGNVEFFLHARPGEPTGTNRPDGAGHGQSAAVPGAAVPGDAVAAVVEDAVMRATGRGS